jgi:hypothetical protein
MESLYKPVKRVNDDHDRSGGEEATVDSVITSGCKALPRTPDEKVTLGCDNGDKKEIVSLVV